MKDEKRTMMTPEKRNALIEQLDISFKTMDEWAKVATKHALGAPTHHPETGEPFKSFREILEAASDETLITLRDDFNDNGDLIKL